MTKQSLCTSRYSGPYIKVCMPVIFLRFAGWPFDASLTFAWLGFITGYFNSKGFLVKEVL